MIVKGVRAYFYVCQKNDVSQSVQVDQCRYCARCPSILYIKL